MQNSSYEKGLFYRALMMRAYKTHEDSKNGIHNSVFQILIDKEENSPYLIKSVEYQKHLEKVKIYLCKAVDKFLKMKFTEAEKNTLQRYKVRIIDAYSSDDLFSLVESLLEFTIKFKEF